MTTASADVELFVIDVPRDGLLELEAAVARLVERHGGRVVRAIALTTDDADASVTASPLRSDRGDASEWLERLDTRATAVVSNSDWVSGDGVGRIDDATGPLFGVNHDDFGLATEVVDLARHLPRSHAVLLIEVRHDWAQDLQALLSSAHAALIDDRVARPAGHRRD